MSTEEDWDVDLPDAKQTNSLPVNNNDLDYTEFAQLTVRSCDEGAHEEVTTTSELSSSPDDCASGTLRYV